MTISRMQQPRQLYGLGSLVKSIGKGVKKLVKSPVGKGLLLAGGFGLAGMGPFSGLAKTGLGRGLAGFFGGGMSPGAMGGKSPGIFNALKRGFQNIPGGTGTKIGIGTALATYLGSQGMEQEQIEEVQRDPNKLRPYLRDLFRKLNPSLPDGQIEEMVEVNVSEYATGGRVGLSDGTPIKMASMDENEREFMRLVEEFMERGFNQQEAIEAAKDELERKSIAKGGRVGLAQGDIARAAGIMGNLPVRKNKAGVTELDLRETGGFIPPVGIKEKADDVPAMLSNNEFVFTADAVRAAGGGNVNKGAQILYDKMKQLESKVG